MRISNRNPEKQGFDRIGGVRVTPISLPPSIAKTAPCRNSIYLPSPLQSSVFAPVMSQFSVSMQNASYQSPIWIKAESFWDSDPWRSGAPHNLRYQTVSNRVSQNRWFSGCCPLTLQLTVWAKRIQQWSAGMSNQFSWIDHSPYWLIPAAQTYLGNINLAS